MLIFNTATHLKHESMFLESKLSKKGGKDSFKDDTNLTILPRDRWANYSHYTAGPRQLDTPTVAKNKNLVSQFDIIPDLVTIFFI